VTFLSVLQHLLQIDASDVVGDVIWETVGKLVEGASMLSGRRADAERLLADGTRRLGRAVTGQRQRRAGQCTDTCQCVCHDDASKFDSTGSLTTSATGRQPSTTTGQCRLDRMLNIPIAGVIEHISSPLPCYYMYTVSQKKTSHFNFRHNFAIC